MKLTNGYRSIPIKRYTFFACLIWSSIVAALFVTEMRNVFESLDHMAENEANAYFERDMTFRRWAGSHGGVYVPVDEDTPPNENLAHVPERDLVTPSGRQLTLMNPAYIMRQIYENFSDIYGVQGKLTSLLPISERNRPDTWEESVLRRFEQGEKKAVERLEKDGRPVLRYMKPIITEDGCLRCHASQGYKAGDIRGAVSITLPLAEFFEKRRDYTRANIVSHGLAWLIGLVGIMLGFFWLHGEIAERDQAQQELRAYRDNLEATVKERTGRLTETNQQLQDEIEKRKTAQQTLARSLDEVFAMAEEVTKKNRALHESHDKLEAAHAELKQAQSQILQREKMATIGQLAAGVAHEINNPIGFVASNLGTLTNYVAKLTDYFEALSRVVGPAEQEALKALKGKLKIDYVLKDIKPLIAESQEGTERVRKIVQGLKTFSRMDEAELKPADINECLESTINIIWNELKYKATLKKDYGELPPVPCYPQQLNQVFMNLLVNASQALAEKGEITVRTWLEGGKVFVAVSDTGCGIPAENLPHLFEPFFTTKAVGKGTGLGLSIAYDIVKKHEGTITVDSVVGKGTTFTVALPVRSNFSKAD